MKERFQEETGYVFGKGKLKIEKMSEVLKECMEKIKVSSAEIVVHGSMEKPYYEIKYCDLSDGHVHIGYSSYDLGNVFGWLEECFEIVKEDRHNMISKQVKELRKYCTELKEYGGWWNNRLACKVNDAADTIELLSAKLKTEKMIGNLAPLIEKFDNEKIKGLTDFEQVQVFNALKYLEIYQKIGTIAELMDLKNNKNGATIGV